MAAVKGAVTCLVIVFCFSLQLTESQSTNNQYVRMIYNLGKAMDDGLDDSELIKLVATVKQITKSFPAMSEESLSEMLENVHTNNAIESATDVYTLEKIRSELASLGTISRSKRSTETNNTQTQQTQPLNGLIGSFMTNLLKNGSSQLANAFGGNAMQGLSKLLAQSPTNSFLNSLMSGILGGNGQQISQLVEPIINSLGKNGNLADILKLIGGTGNSNTSATISKLLQNTDLQSMLGSLLTPGQENPLGDLLSSMGGNNNGLQGLGSVLNMVQGLTGIMDTSNLNTTVSNECVADLQRLKTGLDLSHPQQWGLRMADALGKPSSGIFEGALQWLGSYDECLRIDHSSGAPFNGKYCLATITIPPAMLYAAGLADLAQFGGPKIGICMPDTCTSSDATTVWSSLLNSTSLGVSVECQEEKKYDTSAIVALTICGFFLALMVLATLFDLCLVKPDRKKEQEHRLMEEKFNIHKAEPNDPAINEISEKAAGGQVSAAINGGFIHDDEATETGQNGDISKISKNKLEPTFTNVSNFKYGVMANQRPANKPRNFEYNPGKMAKIFLSFSIYSNTKKIFNTSQGSGALSSINGIRFISMSWVILGHTIAFTVSVLNNAGYVYPEYLKRFSFAAISNAEVSVDTFFTLSGLLLAYLFLREMDRERGKVNWFMFYFHRIWRLTPPYMLVLMVERGLSAHFSNGPLYPKDGFEPTCDDYWWRNLLYINNFFPLTQLCMGWSWYLANDMQFYIISPLILVPLFYWRRLGKVVAGIFLLGMTISAITVSAVNDLPPVLSSLIQFDIATYFNSYYIRPYCRMGPYIVGIITGYALYKSKCKVKMNKAFSIGVWVVAIVFACLVLYGTYDHSRGIAMNSTFAAIYNGTSRTIWGACVCWVIFACSTGYGGLINKFLSWKAFIPLGRLTYCAYLVHPLVMYTYNFSLRQPLEWSDVSFAYLFLAHLVLSYGFAFITSLAFEAPMMGLEKAILRRK